MRGNPLTHAKPPVAFSSRRGMLLLLVLLMLAIFLMLGILGMTLATRSRTSAHAGSTAQLSDFAAPVMARRLLDEALLKVVRGPSAPGASDDVPESLLEDMYCGERDLNGNLKYEAATDDPAEDANGDGEPQPPRHDSLTGRLIEVGTAMGPLKQVTVQVMKEKKAGDQGYAPRPGAFQQLWNPEHDRNNNGMYDPPPTAISLHGRLITFMPADKGQPFAPATYRILRAAKSGKRAEDSDSISFDCIITDTVRNGERSIPGEPPRSPATHPTNVVINGPAFRAEPYDHAGEPWMATYRGGEVDNDNDGEPESRWLTNVLPVIRAADGRTLACQVSVLVKDLDGRINLNAHGAPPRINPASNKPYPKYPEYTVNRRTVPIGMGYGPADVDASALFAAMPNLNLSSSARTFPETSSATILPLPYGRWLDGRPQSTTSGWRLLLFGDADAPPSPPPSEYDPRFIQRRPAPVVGPVLGRYGQSAGNATAAVPGVAGADSAGTLLDNELTAKANSPSDLKARTQVLTRAPANGKGATTLVFYTPTPSTNSDVVDDPYEMRLDLGRASTGSFGESSASSPDTPFTLAELERVLRQFDTDASTLPPRLAAILGARLDPDRNDNGQIDGEEQPLQQAADGEDKGSASQRPNGMLDDGEDTNGNGILDLASDTNNSGFRDVPEARVAGGSRYWPSEVPLPSALPDWNENKLRRQTWERDHTEALRNLITTDSWDTPGLVGAAAAQIEDFLTKNPAVIPAMSPDILSGLRLDINRPIANDAGQQEFCKHLMLLLMALGEADPAKAAQWAVNIADYRDADSIMTVFPYDAAPLDGWATTASSPTVIGMERPEVLIHETASWVDRSGTPTGELCIALYRPWLAIHRRGPGPMATPAATTPAMLSTSVAEPPDPLLTGGATETGTGGDENQNGVPNEPLVDLRRIVKVGPTISPVWRLKFTDSGTTKYIRFDDLKQGNKPDPTLIGAKILGGAQTDTQIQKATRLIADSYLFLLPPNGPQKGITVGSNKIVMDEGSMFLSQPGTTTLELQRLAHPGFIENATTNPYCTIDTLTIDTKDQTPLVPPVPNQPPPVVKVTRYAAPVTTGSATPNPLDGLRTLWRSKSTGANPTLISGSNASLNGLTEEAPWMHWPNRPFVSVAELMLVPTRKSAESLENYTIPFWQPTLAAKPSSPGDLLLDACHVYSRFAGTRTSIPATPQAGQDAIAVLGAATLLGDHLSTWREPGRINLLTADPVVTIPLAIGRLDGRTYPPIPKRDPSTDVSLPHPVAPTAAMLTPLLAGLDKVTSPELFIEKNQADLAKPTGYEPFNPSKNPFFLLHPAIRLPNVATTRSHVFAIWITLRLTDQSDGSFNDYRLFAIVDRSIPVGFLHGADLNVRDAVVLQRYLD